MAKIEKEKLIHGSIGALCGAFIGLVTTGLLYNTILIPETYAAQTAATCLIPLSFALLGSFWATSK